MQSLDSRASGQEFGMALEEAIFSLASLASRTVVAAAVTDAWGIAKPGFARVLGRGDPHRTELAERRLEQAHQQLAGIPSPELERVQADLEAAWQARLLDLLEEHPDSAADLRPLVDQIQARLSAGAISAFDHGVAAGRDVPIAASGGGVAAGSIRGDVTPGNSIGPDPGGITGGAESISMTDHPADSAEVELPFPIIEERLLPFIPRRFFRRVRRPLEDLPAVRPGSILVFRYANSASVAPERVDMSGARRRRP
jgi:hypothetical protein